MVAKNVEKENRAVRAFFKTSFFVSTLAFSYARKDKMATHITVTINHYQRFSFIFCVHLLSLDVCYNDFWVDLRFFVL